MPGFPAERFHPQPEAGPGCRRARARRGAAGRQGRARRFRGVVAPFGEDRRAEAGAARHEAEVGFLRHGAGAGIARHGGADDIGTGRKGRARLVLRGDIGHGETAVPLDLGDQRRHGDRARTVRCIDRDDGGTRLGKRRNVRQERRDAHGAVVEIAFDETDDRQPARPGDASDIGTAFDAQSGRAGAFGGPRIGHHRCHGVERAGGNRLAGDDQPPLQPRENGLEVVHRGSSLSRAARQGRVVKGASAWPVWFALRRETDLKYP